LSTGLLDKLTPQGIVEYQAECQKSFDAVVELVYAATAALDELFAARVTLMQEANKGGRRTRRRQRSG